MADVIVIGETNQLFSVEFHLRSRTDAESFGTCQTGDDIVAWLQTCGYSDVVRDLYYRQIYVGLLSDMCHFLYEALQSSRKGKLAVAYSLLRKPLKDNLLCLERLLTEPDDMLRAFDSDRSAVELATESLCQERKRKIIADAANQALVEGCIDPGKIYELRYDKSSVVSFEPIWQKAIHLVTTSSHYTTESGNLNFVFSGDSERISQWDFMYSYLPVVMFHTYSVVFALAKTIGIEEIPERGMGLRATLGLLVCCKELSHVVDNSKLLEHCARCSYCGRTLAELGEKGLAFVLQRKLRCPNCRKVVAT
jgi:hypothetical protein